MAIVVMPSETANRIRVRVLELAKNTDVRLFFANDHVQQLYFTKEDIADFDGETGEAVVLAIERIDDLKKAIPSVENGKLNYIEVVNQKIIAKLDPFSKKNKNKLHSER